MARMHRHIGATNATRLEGMMFDALRNQHRRASVVRKRMNIDKLCRRLDLDRSHKNALRQSLRADIRFTVIAEMVYISSGER